MDFPLLAGVLAAGLGSPFLVEMARGYWVKRQGDGDESLKLIQEMRSQITGLFMEVNSLRNEADNCHKNNASLQAQFDIFKAEHKSCETKA